MKLQTKATAVGSFVVISFIILLVFMFAFATRQTLETRRTYIMRFDGSLKGLHVGSSVVYRGIKIGEVVKIQMQVDHKTEMPIIPVWIRFQRGIAEDEEYYRRLNFLIKEGMRGQLQTANLLTGEQNISLIFKPNTPVKLYYPGHLEIPTIKSATQTIVMRETLERAKKAIKSIDNFFKSKKLADAVVNTRNAFRSANNVFKKANYQLDPVSIEFVATLKSLRQAAQSFQNLTDYLARHPSSIITGKH